MGIDAMTVNLLGSTLAKDFTRKLFMNIANLRIATVETLTPEVPKDEASGELKTLQEADLIQPSTSGEQYYVTAKGLKVARDIEKLRNF